MNSDPSPSGVRIAELERRLRELDAHAGELQRELAQARERLQVQELAQSALRDDAQQARRIDAASGLLNRAAFLERLEQPLADLAAGGREAAVLVLGIDRLARLREALGHESADAIARRIADRLQDGLGELLPRGGARTPAPLVALARVGDDEFALGLAPSTGLDLPACAQRMIQVIDGPMRVGDTDLRLLATAGLAVAPRDGARAEIVLANAQAALRFARECGGQEVEQYRESIGLEAAHRLRLEADLRRGLEQREFRVHYQPRVRLRGRRVLGFEALLRWSHPQRGLLSAGEFIDVAVETGLITPIGETVLHQACRDAASWPRAIGLSVNLSAREFRGARLEEVVDSALDASGLAPARLSIELAESSVQGEQTDVALVRLAALRERGVQLILDNYGAGSGGLDLLRRYRADAVKISPRLLAGIEFDQEVYAVVRAIASLSRQFGAAVIAQGVEREAQLEAALRAGCTQGQGYLLGAIAAAEAVGAGLRKARKRAV